MLKRSVQYEKGRIKKSIKPLFVSVGMCLSGTVSAMTTWVPTDGNLNTFDFSYGGAGLQFAFFDDSNFALDDELGFLSLAMFDKVELQAAGQDWTITNNNGDSLILTGTDQFLIAANDGSGWSGDTGFSMLGGSGSYDIEFYDGLTLMVVDASPVLATPVPAAVWLFGSGLVGLIGLAKQRNLRNE